MMTLIEGTVFTMSDEMKKDIPLQFRLAALELSNQFFKVVADDWHPADGLHVRVYRDKDTVNPTTYFIRQVPSGVMIRQEDNTRRTQWNIYSTDPKPAPPVPVTKRARPRRAPTPSEVTEHNGTLNIQSLFVQRAEIGDELRMVELRFTRDPSPEHVVQLQALRKKLTGLEVAIVSAASLAKMQT